MKEKVLYKHFDSLGEMSEWIRTTPQTKLGEKFNASNDERPYKAKTFYLTENFTEADNLLLHGDAENAAKIEKYLKQITAGKDSKSKGFRAKEMRNGFRVSPVGFCPVVPKVLAGDPDNMISLHRELKSTSKVLNIILSCTTSCDINGEEMNLCFSRILCALISLENLGYRINIKLVEAVYMSGGMHYISVKVKESGKKLDLLRVAYPLVHPSFLRRHVCAVNERLHGKGIRLNGCYGRVISPETKEGMKIIKGDRKNVAVLDYETCKNKNVGEIMDFIKSQF